MNGLTKRLMTVACVLGICFCANQAFAGDTTELVDTGSLEVDPVFTLDNLHDGKPCVATELGVVYGVINGLNIGGSVSYGSAIGMAGIDDLSFGINAITTPVDTDHFDMDFTANFDLSIYDGYSITPELEFNFDLDPDLESWGVYARVGLPIHGEFDETKVKEGEDPGDDAAKADVDLTLTLGTYLTFAEIHQVLLEGGFTYANLAEKTGDRELVEPFVSVGYNVQITDTFELTTEVAFNIPKGDDEFSAAIAIGGVFGIPGASAADESGSDESNANEEI